jgi:hypothetical protein
MSRSRRRIKNPVEAVLTTPVTAVRSCHPWLWGLGGAVVGIAVFAVLEDYLFKKSGAALLVPVGSGGGGQWSGALSGNAPPYPRAFKRGVRIAGERFPATRATSVGPAGYHRSSLARLGSTGPAKAYTPPVWDQLPFDRSIYPPW